MSADGDHGEPLSERFADEETEKQMIASVLVDNEILDRCDLTDRDFSEPAHQASWEAIRETVRGGAMATAATVGIKYPKIRTYLTEIARAAANGAYRWDQLAARIRDLSDRRQQRAVLAAAMASLSDTTKPASELAAEAIGKLGKVSVSRTSRSRKAVAAAMIERIKIPPIIHSTGLLPLDNAIGGGLIAGKLYGIAARKKVGKTKLLSSISYNMNENRVRHLFIALEASPEEIEEVHAARWGGYNSIKFMTRDMPDLVTRVEQYNEEVPNQIIYEHAPGATLDAIRKMISSAAIRGASGVFLDYWQLVTGKAKNETEEFHLRAVAQCLADLARKLNIWIVVAAQINQEGNTRGGEGLKLACDMYLTLHREKDQDGAWLEMEESRFTLYQNIGSENDPALWLQKRGPYFSDAPPPIEFPNSMRNHGGGQP
jgi:replicative DNA helicase